MEDRRSGAQEGWSSVMESEKSVCGGSAGYRLFVIQRK